jgi:nitroreductase/NAD-dependent dihydropyrimidine dehydrogenase PreA subunit
MNKIRRKLMLQFEIKEENCTKCGLCAKDCVVKIIDMSTGYPRISAENEVVCLRCRHCLAVCPAGALSILGKKPEDSRSLHGNLPAPDNLEILIKGRRTVRQYRDENLDPELMQRLLDVTWHAPTGHNDRQVLFTVVDDKEAMAGLRNQAMEGLTNYVREDQLPKQHGVIAKVASMWQEYGIDAIFWGAPHLIVASAPKGCTTPEADCLIALSYFELFAQSLGVGTVWGGVSTWTLDHYVSELRQHLGIPADHLIGYAMAFGTPAVQYHRTLEKGEANVLRVSSW